ncbi:MAG: hypothetical protein L3J06_05135 [Cyclobacteriaceae bacterium]|nr:hypothetical protein [Cyclobacteriaceae bacterium]
MNLNKIILYKWKKKIGNLMAIGGLSLFSFFVFKLTYQAYHLKYYSEETLGRVDSIYIDWRYNKNVNYSFKVNDEFYYKSAWYDNKVKPKVGDYYRVKYSRKNPSISRIFFRGN